VVIEDHQIAALTDTNGYFILEHIPDDPLTIIVTYLGYKEERISIGPQTNSDQIISIEMTQSLGALDEVVVTGTMRSVRKSESPVPVEVYRPTFFRKNPTPNIYEALQGVNGVRPQLNCNICNTGDIHINGLEGPYTMVLIDGMPIVSSLASVYGLSGIPNSLVERMEIIKGPASALYGSEAIGGVINIITKDASRAPVLSLDFFSTSWLENNLDLGFSHRFSEKSSILTGINMFYYDNPEDHNKDNFTDIALQERISIFQKWTLDLADNRQFSLAGRYYVEDRWGGDLRWDSGYRGGEEIYGESIFTRRWEAISKYDLPGVKNLQLMASLVGHHQDAAYGNTLYRADQNIAFGQLTWSRNNSTHDFLLGSSIRYTFYDDNTPATGSVNPDETSNPEKTMLYGLFAQDEMKLNDDHRFLLGLRTDYHEDHGTIFTPRLAYKWKFSPTNTLRFNFGTGFRVVNIFTEEHAALTGAREVIIKEDILPERSVNFNINYVKKFYLRDGGSIGLDFSTWYTRFSNLILPDYDANPNQIIYQNLAGIGVSQGISMNADIFLTNGFSAKAGVSFIDVKEVNDGVTERPFLTERFSGSWNVSYEWNQGIWQIDYTGNVYGPMRLPLGSALDPRPAESGYWSLQNIQGTRKLSKKTELYFGMKNILNWTPADDVDFLISRSNDPFDKNVLFDASEQAIPNQENPYGLTFDPAYVYAPNQGRRIFLGFRYELSK
jgi:outer membrane receptor for ferrienterochelin and colicins